MKKRDEKKKLAIEVAAKSYLSRQSRADHPVGEFDFCGCWQPAKEERCKECGRVRKPSQNFPYTLSQHCRTALHIANLHKVDRVELLKAAKILKKEAR
jgi:hypothetical protein